jgi:hypothetical protein
MNLSVGRRVRVLGFMVCCKGDGVTVFLGSSISFSPSFSLSPDSIDPPTSRQDVPPSLTHSYRCAAGWLASPGGEAYLAGKRDVGKA